MVQQDVLLLSHAAKAERYVFDDPNSALVKLRQLAEILHGALRLIWGLRSRRMRVLSTLNDHCETRAIWTIKITESCET